MQANIFPLISDVESDLPEDLKNEASLRFQAAIDGNLPIGSATEKVQEEVLSKCNDVFKGKRYKKKCDRGRCHPFFL